MLPLTRPESHAHLCEGRGWLEILPKFHGMRKAPLSQRKEVVVGHVLYQNKMEEGTKWRKGQKIRTKNTGSSLHACCLFSVILNQWKTQKTKVRGTHHQECYSRQQGCPSQDAVSLTASTLPSPFSHPPHPTHCGENIICE